MEINITRFVDEACPRDYSASVAEIGASAGPDTWRAACDDSDDYGFLSTAEELQSFREWLKPFGAWDAEEIAAFSDNELRALFTQWVSGDMRECGIEDGCNWADIVARQSEGQAPSNIWRNDGTGEVFFSLEH